MSIVRALFAAFVPLLGSQAARQGSATTAVVHAEPARPRLALTFLADVMTDEVSQGIARYSFAIIGMSAWPNRADRARAYTAQIKALNPDITLAQYSILAETRPTGPRGSGRAAGRRHRGRRLVAARRHGRARPRQAVQGVEHQLHPMDAARRQRRALPQIKARNDYETLLKNMPLVEYVFIDGVGDPMFNGDFKRDGTDQSAPTPKWRLRSAKASSPMSKR